MKISNENETRKINIELNKHYVRKIPSRAASISDFGATLARDFT